MHFSRHPRRRLSIPAVSVALVLAALPIAAQPLAPQPPPPSAAAAPTPAFDPETLPEVVARVNGTEIKRDEVIEEARGAYAQLRRMGRTPAIDAAFFRGALDQRIASMLLQAEVQSRGLAVTPEEIDARLALARERFESDEAFAKSLAAEGLTPQEARAETEREIARFKYVENVILPEIQISEQALREFYDQNQKLMQQPERVKVRHILIRVAPTATEDERRSARTRAEGLLAKARAGEDFAALARANSDDPTKNAGGELPWLSRDDIKLDAFEQVSFSLEKGAISELVESPAGFHILQSVDRMPARTAEFDEVKDKILSLLQTQAAQDRLKQTVEGLMAKASIERFGL